MKSNRVYFGTTYYLKNYQLEDIYGRLTVTKKEMIITDYYAILIKLNDKEYVKLEDFHLYLYFRKFFPELSQEKILFEDDSVLQQGNNYVDRTSLRPYLSVNCDVSLKRIKQRQATQR